MAKDEPDLFNDQKGTGIQALGPYHADTVTASITDDTAQNLTIPTGTQLYELATVIPVYVNANGTATASSAVFPAGVATYKVIPGQTTVSVKRISTSDTGPVTLTPVG